MFRVPEASRAGAHRYVRWLLGRTRLVLLLAVVLALVTGVRTVLTYSNLRSDLEELLPETAPSVLALASARERLPGLRHLGVVVDAGEPDNIAAALRFVSDLEQRVAAYPANQVALVRSGIRAERDLA